MAQKKLSERITERAQKQLFGGKKQRYQAIFLSLREEIEEAFSAGWKVKTIWETLHSEKKFEGTYECFLSYFNKIIKNEAGEQPSSPLPLKHNNVSPGEPSTGKNGHDKNVEGNSIKSFRHPDTYNAKDLMGD